MSNLYKREAFNSCFSELVIEVKHTVKSIADKCKAKTIISGDVHDSIMSQSKLEGDGDGARTLLRAVESRIWNQDESIESNTCAFKLFKGILEAEPSLTHLAKKLTRALDDIEDRAQKHPCTDDDSVQVVYRVPKDIPKGLSSSPTTFTSTLHPAVPKSLRNRFPTEGECPPPQPATSHDGGNLLVGVGGLSGDHRSTKKLLSQCQEFIDNAQKSSDLDEARRDRLIDDCDKLTKQVGLLETEKEQRDKKLKKNRSELSELRKQKQMMSVQLRSEIDDLEQRELSTKDEIADLNKKCKRYESRIAKYEKEIAKYRDEVSQNASDNDDLQKELKRTEESLRIARKEKEEATKSLQLKDDEFKVLSTRKDEAERPSSTIQELNDKIADRESEIKRLSCELAACISREQPLKQKVQGLYQEIASLTSENKKLVRKNSELQMSVVAQLNHRLEKNSHCSREFLIVTTTVLFLFLIVLICIVALYSFLLLYYYGSNNCVRHNIIH